MDYYNHPHLLDCNYPQKLERDKYPLKYVCENNYLTLPNLKEFDIPPRVLDNIFTNLVLNIDSDISSV
ncbi:13498_t:CDS:2 [Funneliformis geosporum]|uniref:13498_t:CDS:1 n=1 Tax=Funneliformis geosporum TaxID=1117311 RepID=A0A9W4WN33_9GLOM|nr:13498_t:CDS:2 [Funneliformis geosporum]